MFLETFFSPSAAAICCYYCLLFLLLPSAVVAAIYTKCPLEYRHLLQFEFYFLFSLPGTAPTRRTSRFAP